MKENNPFSTKQIIVRLMKRAELLNKEFTGHKINSQMQISADEIQDEIKRREMVSPRWRFET